MSYLIQNESNQRVARVRELLKAKNLDLALVYYDEFNIGNGWYLTGWCPQFESGAVLVPREGDPEVAGKVLISVETRYGDGGHHDPRSPWASVFSRNRLAGKF